MDEIKLWCCEGNANYFYVSIPPTQSISCLKERIFEKGRDSFNGLDAKNLILTKRLAKGVGHCIEIVIGVGKHVLVHSEVSHCVIVRLGLAACTCALASIWKLDDKIIKQDYAPMKGAAGSPGSALGCSSEAAISAILHLQVDIALDDVEAIISSGQYQPNANSQQLQPTKKISDIWPVQPPSNHLHIFVELPHREGSSTLVQMADGKLVPGKGKVCQIEVDTKVGPPISTTGWELNPAPLPLFIKTCVLSPAASNFELLARGGSIVDKTQAILDFLEEDQPVDLLLCPCRSGKTTLLDTFCEFFEDKRDPTKAEKPHYDSGEDSTYSTLESIFNVQLKNVLKEYSRTVLCTLPTASDLTATSNQVQNFSPNNLSPDEWMEALRNLTEFTFALTELRMVVLVDKYDTPISEALKHGYLEQANSFFTNIFQPLLKNNPYLQGALLVSILPLAKASWLSGLDNIQVNMSFIPSFSNQ
ncbi:hypothetical protein BC827DRAFT_1159892 [Russula dissimulans]|nr:hypothetical protein BC827DRAFT_1159892 [Russula dissimulans]